MILRKLSALPMRLKQIYDGTLQGTPSPFSHVYLLTALILLALPLVASGGLLRHQRKNRIINVARILIGTYGAMIVLPTVLWFAYPEPYLIARSIGYTGLLVVVLLIANMELVARTFGSELSRDKITYSGLALVAVLALNSTLASANLWTSFRGMHARDIQLADDIVADARKLPGFDVSSTPIRTVGGVDYSNLAFGGFTPVGTFHDGIDMNAVFTVRYDAPLWASSMPFSPRVCPAYPADGSVFMSDETLFVCLTENDGPPQLNACVPFDYGAGRVAACWTESVFVLVAYSCDNISLDKGDIEVVLSSASRHRKLHFYHQYAPSLINQICMRAVPLRSTEFETLTFNLRARKDVADFRTVLATADAAPLARVLGGEKPRGEQD